MEHTYLTVLINTMNYLHKQPLNHFKFSQFAVTDKRCTRQNPVAAYKWTENET